MKLIKNHFWFFLFLSFYFLIISLKIISNPVPFYDWDEAIYMQVGKEMVEKKSLIPLWQGKYWLDKPPLVMFIYGAILKLFFFIPPEISARLFNILINLIFFILIYFLTFKNTQSKFTPFLTVFLTSFTPLFIQRAHTINMDVFLGIGWIGYFLFYPNFILSTLFLSSAIFSKSLLGFYPIILNFFYFFFLFFYLKKIKLTEFIKNIKILFSQIFLFSLWYIFMFLKFGNDFLYQHIYESHFKRVTASIEFHFGERIFYFFELIKQFDFFSIFSFLGVFLIFFLFLNKKITLKQIYYFNLFLPWFLFLNLTKTKIFWYIYPTLPQFSFYIAYILNLIKNIKKIGKILIGLILVVIAYWCIIINNFLSSQFSSYDKFYYFSQFSKNNCQKIYFLPENSHRQAINELEKMNLTITTTKWWGGHPALVYYTDNKINFIYDEKSFFKSINQKNKNDCFAYFNNENLNFRKNQVKLLKKFEDILLFK